jgi:hypothetical protein
MAYNVAQNQREAELRAIFQGIDEGMRSLIEPLIIDTAFLEGELSRLRGLQKIRVHPSDPQRQQSTPAAKLYKEYIQQYTNCIKVLAGVLHSSGSTPLIDSSYNPTNTTLIVKKGEVIHILGGDSDMRYMECNNCELIFSGYSASEQYYICSVRIDGNAVIDLV